MATFEITSPDGAKYQVTAPENATQDQIMSYVQAQSKPNTAPSEIGSSLQAGLIGAGKTLTNLGRGAQQLYYGATGNDQASADLKSRADEDNALYKPLSAKFPFATAIGEGAPVIAGGPVTMGLAGAAEYGTPEERATRGASGFVGGKAGQLLGKGIGYVAQPIRSAASDATQALFEKYGMQGLPGQITGSAPLQWIESTLAKLPGGGRVRDAMAGQQQGLNRATMGAMGAEGSAVTPEAVQAAKAAVGSSIGEIPKGTTVGISDNLLTALGNVESRYTSKLDSLQKPMISNLIDDILAQGKSMTGEFYQRTRSDIGSMAQAAGGSYKDALKGIQKALDRAFDESAGTESAAAMATARGQYSAAKSIEKMATETGNISSARLAGAAKSLPPSARELATLGQSMKGLPDSGTAQRLFYQSLLSGGLGGAGYLAGDPETAAKAAGAAFVGPWLASQLLTRAPIKNYLTKGLLDVTPEIEKLLSRAGGAGGGLLGLSLAR